MKNTLRCSKCQGKRIWVIERYRIPGESAEGRELSVVPHQAGVRSGMFASLRASPRGTFDLFVCDGCGFSELWAQGMDDLVADPAKGIRLLDGSDPARTPFR